MDTLKERKDVIIGVVLALIVGLLLGYGWGRQTGGAAETMSTTEVAGTSTGEMRTSGTGLTGSTGGAVTGTVAEGDSVSVVDQPAGMDVAIRSVTLTQAGWVAVRDSKGTTLGAALFPAGTHSNVSVPLLKPTVAGGNYQALIYFDDGTKTFNLKTETIVLNPDGSVAGSAFNAR